MAKFSRFDSRNKKRGKHKHESQERDLKIKHINKPSKYKIDAKLYNEKTFTQEQKAL